MEFFKESDNIALKLGSFGHVFLRPFCTQKGGEHNDSTGDRSEMPRWSFHSAPEQPSSGQRRYSSELSNEKVCGLKLQEERLQTYQLEGATLEHILARRCTEGFVVVSVTEERTRGSGAPHVQGKFRSVYYFVIIIILT